MTKGMAILLGLSLAALSLAGCGDGGVAQPTPTPTPKVSEASPTPTAEVPTTPAATPTPSPTSSPTPTPATVPTGTPFSFDDFRMAWEARSMTVTLGAPSAAFKGFATPAFDAGLARDGDSLDLSILVYADRQAMGEDWDLTVGESPVPKEGRVVPDHISTWWNENVVVVVRATVGNMASDALDAFLSPGEPIPGTAVPSGHGIYLIRPDGRDLRLVKPGVNSARFSPTDNRLAITEFCEAPSTVVMADLDAGTSETIATFTGIITNTAWSPDGDRLLVGVINESNPRTPVVYLVDAEGIHLPTELFVGNVFGWSPNGEQIAFAPPPAAESRLHIFNLGDRSTISVETDGNVSNAVWSPDGGRLAYSSHSPSYQDSHVVTVDRRGQNSRLLTEGAVVHSWSADGKRIYVVLSTGEQNAPFAVVPSDGYSPPVSLGVAGHVEVAPDENTMAVYRHYGIQQTEIVIVNAEGRSPRRVSGAVSPVGEMAFSPDGRALAFSGEERQYDASGAIISASGWNVYTVGLDGANLQRLLSPEVNVVFNDWSPDGRWIMFYVGPITGCEEPFGSGSPTP
jgi:Tol biopolymer transport system component